MEPGSSGQELYNINLIPSELFLKLRKETERFQIGLNLELYNAPSNKYKAKLVLKPLSCDRKWRFIYEPLHHDVSLLSKKIPITKFLNLQVGICHNFQLCATSWKWKLTTCLGGDGVPRRIPLGFCPGVDLRFGLRAEYILPEITGAVGTNEPLVNLNLGRLQSSLDGISRIGDKTSLGLSPGVDLRFGWRADYVLPEITGAVVTGEPLFGMKSGRLQASLDRIEAILTIRHHKDLSKGQECSKNSGTVLKA